MVCKHFLQTDKVIEMDWLKVLLNLYLKNSICLHKKLKLEYHSPHNHGSTGLAGILYLDLPKDSPVTSYIQPWQDYVNDTTIFNPLLVTEGEIVIVPQSVLHFSSPNKSTNKKRIISWDMNILPQE